MMNIRRMCVCKFQFHWKNGLLADEYGKYAPASAMLADHPIKSFPISINDAPATTKSFALVFVDFDSHRSAVLPGFTG